jgi:plastocyanin
MKLKLSIVLICVLAFASTAFASFSDVPAAHVNYDAITYVEDLGIVQGYTDGTYRPDTPINRVEFTKIIIATKYSQSVIDSCRSASFSDVGDGAWYAPYVCVAEQNNIVDGYPDGTYQPANLITFAEASKIITNTLIEPTTQGTEIWYKPYVVKLENINAIPTTIDSFDHKLTRGEMAEMIYRIQEDIRNLPSKTYDELVTPGTSANEPSFDLTATNYQYSETELRVKQGDTVTVSITSEVGIHNFNIDELNVHSLTVTSGNTTEVTFTATQKGTFEYYCNISNHRELGMVGNLIVE